MENSQELEAALNKIMPVNFLTSKTFLERMTLPISRSGAVLMAITYISKNDIVILICSILIVMILTTSLIMIQRSKNVDRRTKRLSWVTLVPLLAFLGMAVSKIFE